jgi:AraC-like DNA-binding protein
MKPTESYNHYYFTRYTFHNPRDNDNREGCTTYFLGYMHKGTGHLYGEGQEIFVKEGDLFYIPRGLRYQSHWEGQSTVSFDSFAFSFFPSEEAYPLQILPMTEEMKQTHAKLSKDKTVNCRSVGLLYLLLSQALPRMERRIPSRAEQAVRLALQYMSNHNEVNVPALAQHCCISESGLYSAFRKYRHTTPVETWHRILIQKGIDLLTTTDLSVEEISRRLGFCSSSYFRKIFRRVTAYTPRQVRSMQSSSPL